jgi:hypothetical protein
MISSMRRAVSCRPLRPALAAIRRRRPAPARWISSASRVISATVLSRRAASWRNLVSRSSGNFTVVRFMVCQHTHPVGSRQRTANRCDATRFNQSEWCPGTELNRRHEDFQSSALPTELPGHPRRGGSDAARKITHVPCFHSPLTAPPPLPGRRLFGVQFRWVREHEAARFPPAIRLRASGARGIRTSMGPRGLHGPNRSLLCRIRGHCLRASGARGFGTVDAARVFRDATFARSRESSIAREDNRVFASSLRAFASSREPVSESARVESGCFEHQLPAAPSGPSLPQPPPSLRVDAYSPHPIPHHPREVAERLGGRTEVGDRGE